MGLSYPSVRQSQTARLPLLDDRCVPTHVALLRGVNVGRANGIAMADLRAVVESLGHTDVATYIQSGNAVFTARPATAGTLAADLERAIAEQVGITCAVVVLSAGKLATVIADNPYAGETNGKFLHVAFGQEALTAAERAHVERAVERATAKGSPDEATVVRGTMYLHTPEGLGRSILAAELNSRKGPDRTTMRNWTTVTKLQAMLRTG